MWFGFREENTWYPLNVARVNEILLMNQKGKKPASLDLDVVAEKTPIQTLNSDLERMDKKYQGKKKKNNKNRKKGGGNKNPNNPNAPQGQQGQGQNPNAKPGNNNPNRNPNPNKPPRTQA
jgi:hypothetical protein